MPGKIEKIPIEDNSGRAGLIVGLHKNKRENVENNKTEVSLKVNDQVSKDYFLYRSINNF